MKNTRLQLEDMAREIEQFQRRRLRLTLAVFIVAFLVSFVIVFAVIT